MGAFRFTDVDRNIIFASTDFDGLTKTAITKSQRTPQKAHYSKSDVADVYGSARVYIDKNVTNENVVLNVVYE